jgi:hypothetical protein
MKLSMPLAGFSPKGDGGKIQRQQWEEKAEEEKEEDRERVRRKRLKEKEYTNERLNKYCIVSIAKDHNHPSDKAVTPLYVVFSPSQLRDSHAMCMNLSPTQLNLTSRDLE